MREAVVMLYGAHTSETYPKDVPWDGYMIPLRNQIQATLAEEGLGLDIAVATERPTGEDALPNVVIARNPEFNCCGDITKATFERGGSIDEYPLVWDNHIDNFHGGVRSGDIVTPRRAFGIGIEPGQTYNYRTFQDLGNDKLAAHAVLQDVDTIGGEVAIPTYTLDALEELGDTHTGEVMYKPNGGARGVGIRRFSSIKALQRARADGELPDTGHVQPRLDIYQPIGGLIGAREDDVRKLAEMNGPDAAALGVPRELRMHAIATEVDGEAQIKAFPVLKIGRPGDETVIDPIMVGIDPSSVPESSPIHRLTVGIARASLKAAGVKQGYMCADWLIQGAISDPVAAAVVDANYRCPGLARKAYAARAGMSQALISTAQRNLG